MLGVATIATVVACMCNFNKGLKSHINDSRLDRNMLEDGEMEMIVTGGHMNRIEQQ